jgi:hypothetical protein
MNALNEERVIEAVSIPFFFAFKISRASGSNPGAIKPSHTF